jgi:signal transduction histidine kinase
VTPAASGGKRRRALSLRARLLAGLIALTAVFLVVMGVVSSLALGKLDQDQFNAELRLAARQPIGQIALAPDGFAAAFLSLRTGAYGELTPSTGASAELRDVLGPLSGQPAKDVDRYLRVLAARDTPFSLPVSGQPTLRVVWRPVVSTGRSADGPLPAGLNVILVGRPVNAVSSQVSGLVRTELITGAVLLALVAACGSWLIGRGLAPLGRMARTADLVTSSGDLTARMPDPNDDHETGRLAGAINTMLDRIQQAFGARLESEQKVRQFAADASHELRTPLTTIRGYAELYRQGALGPGELPNAMRRIEQEADRMSMLVAELLELARLDRASSLDLTETDLAALARDAVADALAVEPGRPVTADVPPSLVVTADEPRIRQVLANLLGNVRAHTPPGTAATVRLYRADGGAVLEVADGGPGMSERDAARAFDRFHRGPRGGDVTGSGLGLSIVAAIAAAHGGHARLRSAPGAGTTVHLWIPVNFPERQGVAVAGPRKSLAGAGQIPRVLPSSATGRPRRGGEAGGHDEHVPGLRPRRAANRAGRAPPPVGGRARGHGGGGRRRRVRGGRGGHRFPGRARGAGGGNPVLGDYPGGHLRPGGGAEQRAQRTRPAGTAAPPERPVRPVHLRDQARGAHAGVRARHDRVGVGR